MSIIERNIEMILALCEKHKVRELSVFGSVLSDRFNDESDIDFVVDFGVMDIAEYADNYLNMQASLSQLLGREIDLLEDKAIRNPILRKNIDRTKQVIYGWVLQEMMPILYHLEQVNINKNGSGRACENIYLSSTQ